MKSLFSHLLVACCVLSCKKNDPITGCENTSLTTVELNNCSTNEGSTDSPAICFTSLKDSRCPLNANCVWQGVAVAKFTLNANAAQHQLTLATAKFPGYPSTDTVVGSYRVKLVNITPYPGSTTNEPARAVLRITR